MNINNTLNRGIRNRTMLLPLALILITAASTRLESNQIGTCGGQSTTIPFDDVLPGNVFFCSIAEAFFSGLSNGTSSTTDKPFGECAARADGRFRHSHDGSVGKAEQQASLDKRSRVQTNEANRTATTTYHYVELAL